MTITLYTRAGCHLCEQAHDLIRRAARGRPVTITPVDIDTDPMLHERYGDRIPVALIGGSELVWPFTQQQAARVLEREAG